MRLIVFDCDGTLLDSGHMIWEAMRAAFARHDLPPPARAATLAAVGLSLPEMLQRLVPHHDMRLRGRLASDYATAFAALRREGGEAMFPGMRELVVGLSEMPGTRLGIATGKSQRGVAAFLDREGLQGLFATIKTADDAPSKPDPAMLRACIAEAGARARPTIMIGDTTYDIEMARAAGVTGIGVAWGHHSTEQLMAAGALAVARDAAALRVLLELASQRAA